MKEDIEKLRNEGIEMWGDWRAVFRILGRGFYKTAILAMRSNSAFTEYVILSQEDERISDSDLFRILDVHPDSFAEREDYHEGLIVVKSYALS